MKDGTTHLAYKAEHVVDLQTEVILAAEIYHADQHDAATLEDSLHQAQIQQARRAARRRSRKWRPTKATTPPRRSPISRSTRPTAVTFPSRPVRTIACGPTSRRSKSGPCTTTGGARAARTVKSCSGCAASAVERSFAHVCETGGARRTWLTGIDKVRKRYLLSAAAHNLGVVMRALFNIGTPRGLQEFRTDLEEVVSSLCLAWLAVRRHGERLLSLATSQAHPHAAIGSGPTFALAA